MERGGGEGSSLRGAELQKDPRTQETSSQGSLVRCDPPLPTAQAQAPGPLKSGRSLIDLCSQGPSRIGTLLGDYIPHERPWLGMSLAANSFKPSLVEEAVENVSAMTNLTPNGDVKSSPSTDGENEGE